MEDVEDGELEEKGGSVDESEDEEIESGAPDGMPEETADGEDTLDVE